MATMPNPPPPRDYRDFYKVITSNDMETFNELINQQLKSGNYLLYGGLMTQYNAAENQIIYIQPLIIRPDGVPKTVQDLEEFNRKYGAALDKEQAENASKVKINPGGEGVEVVEPETVEQASEAIEGEVVSSSGETPELPFIRNGTVDDAEIVTTDSESKTE
jgi:hypothetical protein